MVNELAFIVYAVRDIARAEAFYTDVLGLKLGGPYGDEFIEFDLGNTTFALDANSEGTGLTPGASSGAAFEVDDIHAARQRLVDAGATVSEVHEFPPCHICFAHDPEGNQFALHQRK